MKEEKKETRVRVNTRITERQHKYIRARAKKLNLTEGEVTRMMLEDYITKNPNK